MRRVLTTIPMIVLAALLAPSALSADEQPAARPTSLRVPIAAMTWLEPGGGFRWRTEVWRDLDLGLSRTANAFGIFRQVYDSGKNPDSRGLPWRETTDFRLRLEPTLWVGERLGVHTRIDLADRVAGGGFPAGILGNAGVIPSATGPQSAGVNGFTDSIQVQAVWAEILMWSFLHVELGRMPVHWGLGILENRGDCVWCDQADVLDSLSLYGSPIKGLMVGVAWDFPLEGLPMTSGGAWPYDQPMDGGDRDDVFQVRFRAFSTAGPEPRDRLGFQWGAYARLRWQNYSSADQDVFRPSCAPQNGWDVPYSCVEIFYRNAFFFTPDAWMQMGWRAGPGRFFLALEGVGQYGDISAVQRLSGVDTSKTMLGGGGVMRGWWENSRLWLGAETGVASGDGDADAFGVLDGFVISDPEDYWQGSVIEANTFVTSHIFSPAYLVDSILFRRVIGAVTNAWYVKPEAVVALWGTRQRGLTARGHFLYAQAMAEEMTPGGSAPLGLEAAAALELRWRHVRAELGGAGLFPLSGFDGPETPGSAWLLRTGLQLSF